MVHTDEIDIRWGAKFLMDPFEEVIEQLSKRHAFNIKKVGRITLTFEYSDEMVLSDIKFYISQYPFLEYENKTF